MSDFKNENARKLTKTIIDAIPDMDARRKGHLARSFLLIIADAFFEDREQIFAEFQKVGVQDHRRAKPGKPPRTFADPKQRTEAVEKHKQLTRSSRVASSSDDSGDCYNCDDDLKKEYQDLKKDDGSGDLEKEKAEVMAEVLPDELDPEILADEETFLDAFDYDVEAMRGFAKEKGVNLGRAKKPESIARTIIKQLSE